MRLSIPAFWTGLLLALSTACFAAGQKPQEIYKANCEGCHGSSGRATDLGKSLGAKSFKDPAVIKAAPSALAKVIAKGRNQMPPFEGTLSAVEIKELAKYIKEMK
jgi:mono/diheme cytochrome c family protein